MLLIFFLESLVRKLLELEKFTEKVSVNISKSSKRVFVVLGVKHGFLSEELRFSSVYSNKTYR